MAPLHTLLAELEVAKDELMAAHGHYAEAVNDVATAKARLESRRAELICHGIEGKNAEQREAALRLELSEAYTELAGLEYELMRVRCRLETAQVAFAGIRYKVRLLEVMKAEVA